MSHTSNRTLIRNGRIIDPANGIDQIGDLQIENGVLTPPNDHFVADQEIDASNKIVCPGLVDLRARLREPGEKHKGTIQSETRAAAAGGVTTLSTPPDTTPVIDSPAVVELIHTRAEEVGSARVIPLGAATKGLNGEELSNMGSLQRVGCAGVSNGHHAVTNALVMRRIFEYATSHQITVFIHPEDPWLRNNGCAHEGTISTRLGLPGIPSAAEAVAVARDLVLIEETGARAHFCGLSSQQALQMIEQAQERGLPVTADVAAHQLYLTEMDLSGFNSLCHVRPPLRTERDRDRLIQGVIQGSIQAICSDHQPHDEDAKAAPFEETDPGISSIETLLPLTLRLQQQGLSLSDAIARITHQPAEILGIDAGTLGHGKRADITIIDPDRWWTVTTDTLHSHGKNTPFLQWELQGQVTHTLMNGIITYEAR